MDGLGRKFYHSLGGVGLISVYYLLGREQALPAYGALFLCVLALEAARLRVPSINHFIVTRFRSFIREKERNALTGTPWYVLGAGLSFLLFAPSVATAAVCFLAFGDVSAATIGQRFGTTKIGSKSLEGSLAFVLACVITGAGLRALGLDLTWPVMLAGAFVAAVVEVAPQPLNDNLAIPMVSGAVMEGLSRFLP